MSSLGTESGSSRACSRSEKGFDKGGRVGVDIRRLEVLVGQLGTNGRGWAVRIFPIRTVSLLIRFGVDPVRPLLANQRAVLPCTTRIWTSVRKVRP